jgi:hypothetical protein
VRRSWQHWLRVCVVALTVPVLTMGPAWAGRGLFRCHRKRCRPACCSPLIFCPSRCETECGACEPVACCTGIETNVADAAKADIDNPAPSLAETPAGPESVVAKPTLPEASTGAETVPPLAPAATVEPASVETATAPARIPELEAELAEMKSELSELSAGMKSALETGLSRLKSDMKTEMSELGSELMSELSTLKSGLKADLATELSELKDKIESIPMPEAQPARPVEENIFDEGQRDPSDEASRQAEKPPAANMKEPPRPETSPDSETEPSRQADTPKTEPKTGQPAARSEGPESPLPLPEIPAPSVEPPAVPAPTTPAPAIDDPFSTLPSEPVRRWFDDTGSHDTVGQLVEVHADHVRIRKLNGRFTTVPISRLSVTDQRYVTATGTRIAATPRLTDTVGIGGHGF